MRIRCQMGGQAAEEYQKTQKEAKLMDDQGSKRLIAAVLKQAYEDYQNPNRCPAWCPMTNCDKRQSDRYACDVLKFIKSAWCSNAV
jgi:hypothetical protein